MTRRELEELLQTAIDLGRVKLQGETATTEELRRASKIIEDSLHRALDKKIKELGL